MSKPLIRVTDPAIKFRRNGQGEWVAVHPCPPKPAAPPVKN